MKESAFKIYNASAGSGKTYALSKAYLKIVLTTPNGFKKILAITFTNKAVNEMKKRVLESLQLFSDTSSNESASPLFITLMEELNVSQPKLQKISAMRLKEILHNYAFFDISTIDKFTHRLIRTFAKDLKLPQNFEVTLDVDILLNEAVSRVIDSAGTNKELTNVLLLFAFEKIDDNKSWDITYDLTKIGTLLFNDTNADHLKKIASKSIADFSTLKKNLAGAVVQHKASVINMAQQQLEIITSNGLEFSDFKGSYFPKFMEKLAAGNLKQDFNSGWKVNFETATLYTKSCKEPTKGILDSLHKEFTALFFSIKEHLMHHNFLRNAYKNIVPLTLLNAIQKQIKEIEKEKEQLSISEFNTIISKEIKNQPAPFIYERLGEKYRHYFIDEFQDTSEMQWQNLIPLIGNALESEDDKGEPGSLFLVGDAKQAIYRWRGGRAEQFVALATSQAQPFSIPSETKVLPRNYRSYNEIIKFNNDFFHTISHHLVNEGYSNFFREGSTQELNNKEGGLVKLSFLEEPLDDDISAKTLASIQESLSQGFQYNDICIIVRKKKHGVLLANYLMAQDIPIISSESLLLSSSLKIKFLMSLARYAQQPQELEICYDLLWFLSDNEEDRHAFIQENLNKIAVLLQDKYAFTIATFKQETVLDGMEYAIKQFDLAPTSDAHLTAFLDTIFDVSQRQGSDIQSFLEYWSAKGEKLSIATPENIKAVRIITIHKSKGLEFPVVIFPFANIKIYEEIDPKLWIPVDATSYNGFSELLISKNKEVLEYGAMEAAIFEEEQNKLQLDAYNLLYVVLTRAVVSLHIICTKDLTKTKVHKPDYFSGLFIDFLIGKEMWDVNQDEYQFGSLAENNFSTEDAPTPNIDIAYTYTSKDRADFKILTKAGMLWDTLQQTAMEEGTIIHEILSYIDYAPDFENAIEKALRAGIITAESRTGITEKISAVLAHPKLQHAFKIGVKVFNEKEILLPDGASLRPDRIVLIGKEATIIDYKTGSPDTKHIRQIKLYASAVAHMGLTVKENIIVYINEEVSVKIV